MARCSSPTTRVDPSVVTVSHRSNMRTSPTGCPGRRDDPGRTRRRSAEGASDRSSGPERDVRDPAQLAARARPGPGADRRPRPRRRPSSARLRTLRDRGHAVEPVHLPGIDDRRRSPACSSSSAIIAFVVSLCVVAAFLARRFTTPLRRLTDAARDLARGRSRQPRPDPARARPARSRSPSCRASSTRWPTGSRRASRSSAATATGVATSWPTCRTSCAPRSRRCGCSTSCSARRPATTRRPAPNSSSRAASSSSASTGWPRTCSSCRSSTRVSCCSTSDRMTCGRRSSRRSSRRSRRPPGAASRWSLHLPAEPDPDPARPAADRPGRHEPRRQRAQVHAARRGGRCRAPIDRPKAPGSSSATRASGSTRSELPHIFERFYRGTHGQRGARQRQRARARDRQVDRRYAQREGRRRQPSRRRDDVHGQPAEGSTGGRRGPAADARDRARRARRRPDPAGGSGFFTIRRLLTKSRTATLALTCRSSAARSPT